MTFDPKSLDTFPTQPGVYLMKNRQGTVLYVGKAKNLRQRVKQYFAVGRDSREMVPHLVARVDTVETIVVLSEKEALLLENNLIKRHHPRFNAFLKDDKSYISLKINTKHPWPMVRVVRYHGKPKADGQYFGPYTSAYAARQTLDLLQRMFPLRQCSDQELARRTRPCILYDMKRCIAPCVGRCTKEEYDGYVQKTIRFLKGQDKDLVKDLKQEMEAAAEKLEFERAANLLRTVQHLERTLETQHVEQVGGGDADVFGIFREADEVVVSQLLVRSGKLVGSKNFNFSHNAQEDAELLESFIIQQYEVSEIPHEVLLPVVIEGASAMEEILTARRERNVSVYCPQRGDKVKLVQMAYANAEATYKKEKDARAIRERMLMEMEEHLRLTRYPRRIECLDNSNTSGTDPVAAMIAFTDGEKDSKRYRLFKLKPEVASDDYAAMHEVLSRRYKRAKEENDLPDLLIVDGGKGQLNIAIKVLSELDISSVDIIGLAKEQGRHDKGATQEQVYLREAKDPVRLKSTSPVLFLLQRIRDEAHRFVITYQRKRRSKKTVKSALDDLAGIGPAKRKMLLKHFGSVRAIKEATEEQLRALPKLTDANIKTLLEFSQH